MNAQISNVDITPTPRVLRVLGEIPFQPWQCFAELIDNSIDAFHVSDSCNEKRIDIIWDTEKVAQDERTIEIRDNAQGMTIEQITHAVKAGYSSNNPVDNLGLFGLGFNIATAKLGEKTVVYSTKVGDPQWIGIEVDFAQLIKDHTFNAPVVYQEKTDVSEHGTRIVISKLNNGIYSSIKSKESAIRKQLENVYSQLLSKQDIEIYIQNKRLQPKRYCVWSKSRFVIRDGERVYAVQEIDRVLGSSFFDIEKNRYLTPEQSDEYETCAPDQLPGNIVLRQKRLKGWVGIQRYFDTNDFGIDFIRNGRKILLSNKEAFSFENEYTGTSILQYPVELGTTVGGRIVGEIEVDYLVPTYQKNDFDRTDSSWKQTLEALRGIGPILPKLRKDMGYTDSNSSPVGILANAYRRTEKGTKNLALARNVATDFLNRFIKGEPDYIDDEKWWQAVVESDRAIASGNADQAGDVDSGDIPSDDPSDYIVDNANTTQQSGESDQTTATSVTSTPVTSQMDALLQTSTEQVTLSKEYSYNHQPPFNVKVHRMDSGKRIYVNGNTIPCVFFSDGIECDFFYDEKHEIIEQYLNTPENFLLMFLAKKFAARDNKNEVEIYAQLTVENFSDKKIDKSSLKEQAHVIFDEVREKMINLLKPRYEDVIKCIKESAGETEETCSAILSDTDLYQAFSLETSESISVLEFVPTKTLIRLVNNFPEELFDNKLFKALYCQISGFTDQNMIARLKEESKDRIVTLLKDAQAIINEQSRRKLHKDELVRYGLSLNILRGVIV